MVELSDDGISGRLEVRAGRSHFSLATLPREDFPIMASSEYSCNFACPAPVLRRLFDKAKFAISTEETRYYLNGVYMHAAKGADGMVLRCVATDGHRLARIDAPLPEEAAGLPGVIVPRKTVGELRKLLDDDDMAIAVSVSETKVRFATPEVTLTSKVIDGTFPDYARVIPKANDKDLKVPNAAFKSAVDRVSTIASERGRAVKLNIKRDKLMLSVNNPEGGSATEELGVEYEAAPLEIGFNARYLLDIANQLESEMAHFQLVDPVSPTMIKDDSDQGALYVPMSMRV
jgi:DNA polymerase-3 subunit beta